MKKKIDTSEEHIKKYMLFLNGLSAAQKTHGCVYDAAHWMKYYRCANGFTSFLKYKDILVDTGKRGKCVLKHEGSFSQEEAKKLYVEFRRWEPKKIQRRKMITHGGRKFVKSNIEETMRQGRLFTDLQLTPKQELENIMDGLGYTIKEKKK